MTPAEVKFELERTLLSLAQGGKVPHIMGVHSVVVEGDTVFVWYDITPEVNGHRVLDFEFERPELVALDDVREFAEWLATSGYDGAVH